MILGTGMGGAFIHQSDTKTSVTPFEPCGMIVEKSQGRKHVVNKTQGLLEAYVGGDSVENFYHKALAQVSDDDPI